MFGVVGIGHIAVSVSIAGQPYVPQTLVVSATSDNQATTSSPLLTINGTAGCYDPTVSLSDSPWLIGLLATSTGSQSITLSGENLGRTVTNWRSSNHASGNGDVLPSGCWYNMIFSYIRSGGGSPSIYSPTISFFYGKLPRTWYSVSSCYD
jgi:hypothetical protein